MAPHGGPAGSSQPFAWQENNIIITKLSDGTYLRKLESSASKTFHCELAESKFKVYTSIDLKVLVFGFTQNGIMI